VFLIFEKEEDRGDEIPEDYELKQRITFVTQTKAQISILRRWQRSAIPTSPSSGRGVVIYHHST